MVLEPISVELTLALGGSYDRRTFTAGIKPYLLDAEPRILFQAIVDGGKAMSICPAGGTLARRDWGDRSVRPRLMMGHGNRPSEALVRSVGG